MSRGGEKSKSRTELLDMRTKGRRVITWKLTRCTAHFHPFVRPIGLVVWRTGYVGAGVRGVYAGRALGGATVLRRRWRCLVRRRVDAPRETTCQGTHGRFGLDRG